MCCPTSHFLGRSTDAWRELVPPLTFQQRYWSAAQEPAVYSAGSLG